MRWWNSYTGEETAIAECTVCIRAHERFDKYQAILDEGIEELWAELVASNFFSDE
jgi:hypothetical protein